MAMAMPIMAGAGMLMGTIGAISSAQAQAANLQAQVNAQNYNAELYRQQARQSMAQAVIDSNAQNNKAESMLGAQRAAIAESGIGFGGTGAGLLAQSAENAEQDRQNTLYSGLLSANSLNAQGQQSTYAADVAESQIGPTIMGGYLSAGANILSGSANYMGNISKQRYATRGMF